MIWNRIDLTRAIREGHIWIIHGLEPHLCFFPVTPRDGPDRASVMESDPGAPVSIFSIQHRLPWMDRTALLNDSWNFDELEWASALQTKKECCFPNSSTIGRHWVSHGTWIKTVIWSQSSAHASMKTEDNGKPLAYAKMQTDWLGL